MNQLLIAALPAIAKAVSPSIREYVEETIEALAGRARVSNNPADLVLIGILCDLLGLDPGGKS